MNSTTSASYSVSKHNPSQAARTMTTTAPQVNNKPKRKQVQAWDIQKLKEYYKNRYHKGKNSDSLSQISLTDLRSDLSYEDISASNHSQDLTQSLAPLDPHRQQNYIKKLDCIKSKFDLKNKDQKEDV